MGYGTMYKDMKGPSSGANKAMGFAGNVKAGRQAKAARQAKKEAAGQPAAPKMSPHVKAQGATSKAAHLQSTKGVMSGGVSRRGQAQLTPVVKTPEVM